MTKDMGSGRILVGPGGLTVGGRDFGSGRKVFWNEYVEGLEHHP